MESIYVAVLLLSVALYAEVGLNTHNESLAQEQVTPKEQNVSTRSWGWNEVCIGSLIIHSLYLTHKIHKLNKAMGAVRDVLIECKQSIEGLETAIDDQNASLRGGTELMDIVKCAMLPEEILTADD